MTVIDWHAPLSRARDHRARAAPRSNVFATMREWRRRVRERGQLAALDDRMLKDIGLTRVDAEFLINKPFWRE